MNDEPPFPAYRMLIGPHERFTRRFETTKTTSQRAPLMRRIRKIILFTCTTCYNVFPSSKLAKEHARTHPTPSKKKRQRKTQTQTGQILQAIHEGATTAQQITEKTRIPQERVHSLLSYHRRKGHVRGFTGKLLLTAKGRQTMPSAA